MLALSAAAASAVPVLPAHAATTLVATLNGNQCTGGPITTCYATGTTAGTGLLTQVGPNGTPVAGGSPGILGLDNTGTMAGFTDSLSTDASGHMILNYSYTGTELATYFGIFQGNSAVGCTGDGCFNNTYLLFYNPAGFTSGTFDLTTLFTKPGVSHIDLFDHGGVPEPSTWAMMLLGFGAIGVAMRRRKARRLQLA
jgi:hypothetical protein